STPRDASTGEHRVCTVVSIDLSGVAALSTRIDPEELKDVSDACAHAAATEIEGLGGVVQESSSDRVIAVFGVPCATDNDAERAIVAALRIDGAIARAPLPRALRGTRLATRIGIA